MRNSEMGQNDPIEQKSIESSGETVKLPESKTLQHFWRGIETGKFVPLTDEEIDDMITSVYFNGEPLTGLTEEEENNIRKGLFKIAKSPSGTKILEDLASKEVVYLPKEKCPDGIFKTKQPLLIIKGTENITGETTTGAIDQDGITLSPAEKIRIFSDIEIWKSAGFHRQGYRPLLRTEETYGEDYGYTREQFVQLVEAIKRRTGKQDIKMLDVGGGIGEACQDAQNLCPEIEAVNLTIDEEPAMFPVKTVLKPAERMPADFREGFDLIVSKTAFGYFVYPDIALENCLQSLSVGGEARILFITGSQEYEVPDYVKRIVMEFRRLKKLAENGYIDLEVNADIFDVKPEDKVEDLPNRFVVIRKKKSLEDNK